MPRPDGPGDIDPDVRRIVRRKVREISSRRALGAEDRQDLEQELIRHVLRRLPAFEPARGHLRAFVKRVVERHATNLERDLRAAKRGPGVLASLDAQAQGADGRPVPLAETIAGRQQDARLGRSARPEAEQAELALDVAAAVAGLPPDLLAVAEALKRGSVTAAAAELGLPRTTLADRVRRLRQLFERKKLEDYL
jgi:RNA polymerase sigma-70 factor (ECF subfamily)